MRREPIPTVPEPEADSVKSPVRTSAVLSVLPLAAWAVLACFQIK